MTSLLLTLRKQVWASLLHPPYTSTPKGILDQPILEHCSSFLVCFCTSITYYMSMSHGPHYMPLHAHVPCFHVSWPQSTSCLSFISRQKAWDLPHVQETYIISSYRVPLTAGLMPGYWQQPLRSLGPGCLPSLSPPQVYEWMITLAVGLRLGTPLCQPHICQPLWRSLLMPSLLTDSAVLKAKAVFHAMPLSMPSYTGH